MNVTIGSGRASPIAIAFLLIATTVAGCSTAPTVGAASAAPQALDEMRTEADATRNVCFDFEAHGGALYQMFVVPILTSKRPGYQGRRADAASDRLPHPDDEGELREGVRCRARPGGTDSRGGD